MEYKECKVRRKILRLAQPNVSRDTEPKNLLSQWPASNSSVSYLLQLISQAGVN